MSVCVEEETRKAKQGSDGGMVGELKGRTKDCRDCGGMEIRKYRKG